MRLVAERELCHEKLGDRFAEALSEYDTQRRLQVLIDEFLTDEMIYGKKVLDVGSGLGFFSERLAARGADITACDLGPELVRRTCERAGCKGEVVDALQLVDHFGPESFDVVVSSECIEHTPSPSVALTQMCHILRPGGYLSLSTPNIVWWPLVKLATVFRMRPFEGYENFSSWRSIRRTLQDQGIEIQQEYGLHLLPFQLKLPRLSMWLDEHAQGLRGGMINICVLGRKGPPAPA